VTLTGTGGTGKTRLALEVAGAVRAEYPEGVWLVELAPLSDPAGVPRAAATALGLQEEAGQPLLATLVAALRPRRLLLLLDNCEHLLDACAALATALLQACPAVRLLATSREALGLAGETAWRVPSLALPETGPLPPPEAVEQVAAVRLFVERAQLVQPDFALGAHNAETVAQICRRLDGIPLALELAAARLRGLSLAHLAARLDQRLGLLSGGSRSALPRQQTLQATVEWSYDLLSAPEQTLFNRLSVFAGGFSLEASEAVCAGGPVAGEDVLDLLLRLVDKSLVSAEGGGGNVERYRLLETLRHFGRERLLEAGEAAEVSTRHLTYICTLAEEAHRDLVYHLSSAYLVAWLDVLEAEHTNIRQALQWALDAGAVQDGLRLAGTLWWYWSESGFNSEGDQWLSALLAVPVAAPRTPVRAWALYSLAFARRSARVLVGAQAVGAETQALAAEALAIAREAGDKELMAFVLALMGRFTTSTYTAAQALVEESLALFRELGSARGVGMTLNSLGDLAWERGDAAAARACWAEGLRSAREADDLQNGARQLGDLGMLAYHQGEYDAARRQIEESLALYRAVHERMGVSIALGCLGAMARAQGDTAAARAYYAEKLALWRSVGDRAGIAATLAELGALAQQEGDLAQAQALFAEALALRRALGRPVEVAASLAHLGGLAAAQGDAARAATLYGEALAVLAPTADRAVAALCLEGVAALAQAAGAVERAAHLWGAAATLRRGTYVLFVWDERTVREGLIAAGRTALGEPAWTAAWAAGQALTLEQAVAQARADLAR
jgi:predicted ATPase